MGTVMNESRRQILLDTPHTETATGAIASFETDMVGRAKEVRVGIEPVQDLNGYDHPWPGGGGKNLLDIDALLDAPNGNMGGYAFEHILSITVEPNTNYTLSTSYAQTGNVLYFNGATASQHTVKADLPRTQMSDADGILLIGLYNRTGIEEFISKSVTVQLEKGSTATAWAPYSNVCPITGREGITVTAAGVNLLSPDVFRDAIVGSCDSRITQNADGSITLPNGSLNIDSSTANRVKLFDNVLPPGQITIVFYGTYSTSRTMWTVFYTDGTSTSFGAGNAGATEARVYQTSSNKTVRFFRLNRDDTKPITFFPDRCGIYIGAPTEYPQFLGSVTPISWTSSAGTVYGGYLTWLWNGTVKLTKTMQGVDMGTLTYTRVTNAAVKGGGSFRANIGARLPGAIYGKMLCSEYYITDIRDISHLPAGSDMLIITTSSANDKNIYVFDSRYSDAASFKSAVSGVQLVYTLATPVTYTLTPTEALVFLRGTNHVWNDINDTTVTYWTHKTGDSV